ncbi:MAG: hypothetical protein GY765_43825 [bacterium]|nr:hypothetical protein [bacterium]
MEVIREIRDIKSERLIISLPKNFMRRRVEILIRPLDDTGEIEPQTDIPAQEEQPTESGLCGIWDDERSADEIIEDIYSARSGFGDRHIEL